jgi:anti-sigma regulatory factor (Ser/Thr protein kinase)
MAMMAPTRAAEVHACRVRLTREPAAAAEARGQIRAAICGWDTPVDLDVAVLLTNELVTNAITHTAGEAITLIIQQYGSGELRVDVCDTSSALPVIANTSPDEETGRGLVLVASLSDEWGILRTRAGKSVYFTLAYRPDLAKAGARYRARSRAAGRVSRRNGRA